MNQPPIFFLPLFAKVLAWTLIIVVAGLFGVILIFGGISTLDLIGTLVSSVIIAYIIHLCLYYGRGSEEK